MNLPDDVPIFGNGRSVNVIKRPMVISPSCLGVPISSSVTSKENSTCSASNTKCARKGRYSVRRLIEKYGRKANMMKWKEQLNSDCPRRDAHGLHERCDLVCPDLPRVLGVQV